MSKQIIISEQQAKMLRQHLLTEAASIDDGYYGGVNCTLNFDEDYYLDYLQENGLEDSPETKKRYAEEQCDWDVEYLDGETWHACDYKTMTFDEMVSDFGERLANDILNDCMDEREHSYEFSCYKDMDDVDVNNPVSLNAAAKKVMGKVDSPCGKFRGWILTDGTVLDAGWDHNACFRVSPQIRYREDFTRLGNIRFSDVSLEFGKYPTSEQLQMVRMYCEYHSNDTIVVDFLGGKNGRADRKYVGLDFSELSDDLYNYYAGRNIIGRDEIYEAVKRAVEEITLYHGTSANFDNFDLAYVLSGWGQMDWGYGIYLSDRFETAKEYSGGHMVYTAEVPEGKFLDSEYISPAETKKLAQEFYEYYTKKDEYGKEAYKGVEREFWDNECKYIGEADNGIQVYNTISTILGDDKRTSEYLYSKGYLGLRFESDFAASGEKFHNYVIFNPKDIKIIKKETL